MVSQFTSKSPVLLPCWCPTAALFLGAATLWLLVSLLGLVLVWCLCPLVLLLLRCSCFSSAATRSVLVLLRRCYWLGARSSSAPLLLTFTHLLRTPTAWAPGRAWRISKFLRRANRERGRRRHSGGALRGRCTGSGRDGVVPKFLLDRQRALRRAATRAAAKACRRLSIWWGRKATRVAAKVCAQRRKKPLRVDANASGRALVTRTPAACRARSTAKR